MVSYMTVTRTRWAFWIAVSCGLVPMIAGVTVFLLWLQMRAEGQMTAGAIILCSGVGAFLIGLVALAFYVRFARQLGRPRSDIVIRTLFAGALLVANFPLAAAIIGQVIHIENLASGSDYIFIIQNVSMHPLTQARVFGSGCDETFGIIAPDTIAKRMLEFETSGSLRFQAVAHMEHYDESLDVYVHPGVAGYTAITVFDDDIVIRHDYNEPITIQTK